MSNANAPRGIVVLTGAGVSAESGLGTFRDVDGIWTKYPLEDLATPEGFARNPDFVQGFYNDRRAQLKTSEPNAAHVALARLEAALQAAGRRFTLVTQNVDHLHESAGSQNVLHMHGELLKVRCQACGSVVRWPDDLTSKTQCPVCEATGLMRPHVVWFGEMPLYMDEIEVELSRADLFVSIGTSGNVYPAAGFVQLARRAGARTLELNLEPSDGATFFDEARYGKASDVVPGWANDIMKWL
ncbi:Sir2 family NAD+-dependent deacetylase [Hyphomonas oceanitis]|uniref:Sir2 family NAD+-dependent deacetylase n=1 Tax=Hyphomonas oceanitis TaxID=81033 RepID=UPI0030017286